MGYVADLAHTVRSMRASQAEAIQDVHKKIERLEQREHHPLWDKMIADWRLVLTELGKDDYK